MSGVKRHRVTLQRRNESYDSFGEPTLSYLDVGVEWAEIRAVSGAERLESQQMQSEISHRVRMRWSPTLSGISAKDRIIEGDTVYDIVWISDPTGRRRELVATVIERV